MITESRVAVPFPFAYGATTTDNPWTTLVPAFCEGPDIVFADGVMHGGGPGWVPRRAADLRAIYTDHVHFTSNGTAPFAALLNADWMVIPLEADPPAHSMYRKALNPMFGPKAVAALDAKMRLYTKGYVRAFRDRGSCDFQKEFAFELPIRVFLELMAMPQEMMPQFLDWANDLLHSQELSVLTSSARQVADYMDAQIAMRRKQPGDDLISQVLATRTEDGRAFTNDELIGLCFNLFLGGMDTVATGLGWQFYHLATNPADQQRLRANPQGIQVAVDELLRFYSVITSYRRCIAPIEISGSLMEPGDWVAMSTSLVGRDDREFDRPNTVDLDRRPRALSFGYGPHACVGLHLARRELKIAMEEVLSAMPEFHLSKDQPVRTLLHNVIQLEQLPLQWNA